MRTLLSSPQQLIDWCNRIIIGSLNLLLIVTPLIFYTQTSELFELNKMNFVYLSAIVMVTAWSTKMVLAKRLMVRRTSFDWWIALLIIALLLSSLLSIHPYTSWWGYYSRFNGGLASWLAYLAIFYTAVNSIGRRNLPSLLVSALIGLLLSALYALPEHLGHSPSCLVITGRFDANCWIQDVTHRVFGTFGQPNWLAAHLVTLWPLALVLTPLTKQLAQLIKLPSSLVGFFLSATLIASLLALLFTKSRSGFLGLLVAIFILLLGAIIPLIWSKMGKKLSTKNRTYQNPNLTSLLSLGRWRIPLAVCLVMIAAIALIGSPYTLSLNQILSSSQEPYPSQVVSQNEPDQIINRLESGGTDSGEIRKIVWLGALKVWLRYPLFGSGPETFAYSYYLDRPLEHNLVSEWNFLYNKAHNEFLNLLATTGLVGVIAYLLIVAWLIHLAWKGWWQGLVLPGEKLKDSNLHQVMAYASLGILAGLGGLMVSNFFGFATVSVMVLMIAMMIWLEFWLYDQPPVKTTVNSIKLTQVAGLVIIFAIAGGLLLSLSKRVTADTLYAKGRSLVTGGEYLFGAEYLTRAARLVPREALYYDELAGAYSRLALEMHQRALELETRLETNPDDEELLAGLESVRELREEFVNRAREFNQLTLELNPVHLNFYKSGARVYNRLAQIDPKYHLKTKEVLEKARRLAPTDPHLSYNLALVYATISDYQDALEMMEITLRMKPDYQAAWYSLGNLYEIMEEEEMAVATYRHLLEQINPGHQEAREALENLGGLD